MNSEVIRILDNFAIKYDFQIYIDKDEIKLIKLLTNENNWNKSYHIHIIEQNDIFCIKSYYKYDKSFERGYFYYKLSKERHPGWEIDMKIRHIMNRYADNFIYNMFCFILKFTDDGRTINPKISNYIEKNTILVNNRNIQLFNLPKSVHNMRELTFREQVVDVEHDEWSWIINVSFLNKKTKNCIDYEELNTELTKLIDDYFSIYGSYHYDIASLLNL